MGVAGSLQGPSPFAHGLISVSGSKPLGCAPAGCSFPPAVPKPSGCHDAQVAAEDSLYTEWPAWLLRSAPEVCAGWRPRRLESFTRLHKLGQGTYSSVYAVRDAHTGQLRALKKVRVDVGDADAVAFAAREVFALRRIDHPNVVKLHGLAVCRDGTEGALNIILDYHEHDLAGVLSTLGGRLAEAVAKRYAEQLFAGLAACHAAGVIHRDLKCSNLLVTNGGGLVIADFGLAALQPLLLVQRGEGGDAAYFAGGTPRAAGAAAAAAGADAALAGGAGCAPLTSRVITLWYRPPELLLGATRYGAEVDLWSAGCILAELCSGAPLLPGRTEVEQLHRTLKLCGSDGAVPTAHAEGGTGGLGCADAGADCGAASCVAWARVPYPRRLGATLAAVGVSASAVALCERLLSMRPEGRGTAAEALASDFFARAEPRAAPADAMPYLAPGCHELAVRRKRAAAAAAAAAQAAALQAQVEGECSAARRSASTVTVGLLQQPVARPPQPPGAWWPGGGSGNRDCADSGGGEPVCSAAARRASIDVCTVGVARAWPPQPPPPLPKPPQALAPQCGVITAAGCNESLVVLPHAPAPTRTYTPPVGPGTPASAAPPFAYG